MMTSEFVQEMEAGMDVMVSPVALDDFMESSEDEFSTPLGMDVDIPECKGIPCRLWNTRCVTLYNTQGVLVGEGTCHSVNSKFVLGANGPLGDIHVAIHILKIHSEEDTLEGFDVYSLIAWPIELVHCRGASLHDHEARDIFNCLQASLSNPLLESSARSYTNVVRNPSRETDLKAKELLTQSSINVVSSKICCSKNCVQPFPREKIRAFRERMYQRSTFKFRAYVKTNVHRSVHHDVSGRKMVVMEGISVCMRVWMLISSVLEATFYRYQKYARDNREARDHGNLGLQKPRQYTKQAAATLKCILDKEADHMPHKTRSTKFGEKVVSMILPSTFQWKGQLKAINDTNATFGLKEVSISNLSKIRSKKFSEFEVKKPGDNFAQCGQCDKLQELRKSVLAGSVSALKWSRWLDKHLAVARAHRELYYANRHRSHNFPHECLTIMHDKMDHAKTACPVFLHKSKETNGLVKLPILVTGMIAYGHRDVRYAHYGLDIFSHDSNYTIASIARLLRDLEGPPKSSSRQLFVGSRSTNFFQKVLKGSKMCQASLPPAPKNPLNWAQLPPILHMQMDNATGDNKNRYVFCFWSLLVANKIFREVYVNFMIVGHTHDDIDALFGRWSMLVKKENFPTVPSLMKSFIDVESIPTIPHLIEEVAYFKGFIVGAFLGGEESLTGHTKPQQVKFYLDSDGVPVMKYKLLCTDLEWLGVDGRGIKLWKEDGEGRSLWPRGVPLPIPPKAIRGVEDIEKGIGGFMKYWENLCVADVTGESRRRYDHLVHYWRGVKDALQETLVGPTVLKDSFWPSTRVEATLEDQLEEDGEDREEFGEDDAYVGPLQGRPQPSFRVDRDVFEGYFVVVRPADGDPRLVWIGRAMSDPDSNPEHPNHVLIQYFCLTSREVDVQQCYTGWDSERGLRWKFDANDPPVWEHTDALMTAWKSQIRKGIHQCQLKISATQIEVINQSLASYH